MASNPILKAISLCCAAHAGQVRKFTGGPYSHHPLRVFLMAATCHYANDDTSEDVAVAALLHDVVEDCDISINDIDREFGMCVGEIVGWLTNPSKLHPDLPREERKAMDRRHIACAPPVVKLIKALDRIDNLRDWSASDPFALRYCDESQRLLDECLGTLPMSLKKTVQQAIDDLRARASAVKVPVLRESELCPPEEDG